jgi:agmatinase
MKLNPTPFLLPPGQAPALEQAAVAILPFPYEGGVSYGLGTAQAPQAVLEASQQLEFYDEVLETEPLKIGMATLAAPIVPAQAEQMVNLLDTRVDDLLRRKKFVIVLGGDHSVTIGYIRALRRHHNVFGVIQLDAHADLRDSYNGSPLSHACVMARVLEFTRATLQIGIRSMSSPEALRIKKERLAVCTMDRWRSGCFNLDAALSALPQKVFITLDVDVFDWSVIASTGTPEPGGMLWHEMLQILQTIFTAKQVIGFDVVELSYRENDVNSAFAVAKLIYKVIGFKFAQQVASPFKHEL